MVTRQHSSRMCTTCLTPVSVLLATTIPSGHTYHPRYTYLPDTYLSGYTYPGYLPPLYIPPRYLPPGIPDTFENITFSQLLLRAVITETGWKTLSVNDRVKQALLNRGAYLSLGSLGDRVGEAVVLPALARVVRLRGGELLALPGTVRGVRRLRVVRLTR